MQKSVRLEDQKKYNSVRYIFRGKKFPYDSDFDISMNLIIIIIKKLTTERNIVFFSQE